MKKKFKKAAQNLGLINQTQQTVTNTLYPITECYNTIKHMFSPPEVEKLVIEPEAWFKLMYFIHLIGDYEISGFGRIQETDEEGTYSLIDVDIIKQTVRGAYVESDEDAVLDFIRRVPVDQRKEWTLDWHSHVNMGTTPSGTDWTNYSDMLKARSGIQFPAMIVNKRDEYTAYQIISEAKHTEIDIYKRAIMGETVPEERLVEIYNECKQKVQTLCTKYAAATGTWYKPQSTTWSNNNQKGWTYYDETDDGYYPRHYWEDEEDDEVVEAKKQGFVFDDDDTDYACDYCGAALTTTEEISNRCCKTCWADFTNNRWSK